MRDLAANAGKGLARFWRAESGATSIEYAVIAAGIAGAVITVVFSVGETLKTEFFEKIKIAPPGQAGDNDPQ